MIRIRPITWPFTTALLLLVIAVALTADAAHAQPIEQRASGKSVAAVAQRLAAEHFGVEANNLHEVALESWEAVVWPDGSIGCAQEGYAYTMAEMDGFILTFAYGEQTTTVHAAERPVFGIIPTDCVGEPRYSPRPDATLDTSALVRTS